MIVMVVRPPSPVSSPPVTLPPPRGREAAAGCSGGPPRREGSPFRVARTLDGSGSRQRPEAPSGPWARGARRRLIASWAFGPRTPPGVYPTRDPDDPAHGAENIP